MNQGPLASPGDKWSDSSPFIEALRCLIAGGIRSRPKGALDLLGTGKPGRSSLRRDAGGALNRMPAT
eukprot:7678407-Pyramimonas_sp.AAC.1